MKKLFNFMLISLVVTGFAFMNTSCSTDPCEDVVCLNNGVPTESGDDCFCDCASGYEGEFCGTEMRDKFIGQYTANEDCLQSSYNVTIAKSSQDVSKILITNLGTWTCSNQPLTMEATVNGNEFNIVEKDYCQGDKFSGSGNINSSHTTINLTYTSTPLSEGSETCVVQMSKQ